MFAQCSYDASGCTKAQHLVRPGGENSSISEPVQADDKHVTARRTRRRGDFDRK